MTSRPSQNVILPWAGFLILVAGIIYQSGGVTGNIKNNSERLDKLEASMTLYTTSVNNINMRLAGVEAKLDILLAIKDRTASGNVLNPRGNVYDDSLINRDWTYPRSLWTFASASPYLQGDARYPKGFTYRTGEIR